MIPTLLAWPGDQLEAAHDSGDVLHLAHALILHSRRCSNLLCLQHSKVPGVSEGLVAGQVGVNLTWF